jgi:peptide chain release factor 1
LFVDLYPFIEKAKPKLKEIEHKLANFDFAVPGSGQQAYQKLSREHQRLTRLMTLWDQREKARLELAENTEMLDLEDDPEMLEVIRDEITNLESSLVKVERDLKTVLLPPHPNENRNTIVEIRPAAGGGEASLFASELYRMYLRFAESKGWKIESLEFSETEVGGLKEAAFSVQGDGVFRFLGHESGVHRVQRIPVTESGGRIHTSTVTVAVLAEAEEVDLQIDPSELRIDVFRSSGPGGQCVNTTDSAVRVTHIPTGVSVASQQEKSQHRNREIAMRILRSRLLEHKQAEEDAKNAAERRSQVGTGDRSERIRTYNFPQNRVTDHRYGITLHSLPAIMQGELDDLLGEIIAINVDRQLLEELV